MTRESDTIHDVCSSRNNDILILDKDWVDEFYFIIFIFDFIFHVFYSSIDVCTGGEES